MCFVSNTTDSTPVVKPAMVPRTHPLADGLDGDVVVHGIVGEERHDLVEIARRPRVAERSDEGERGVSHRADSTGRAQATGSNGPSTSSSGGPGGVGARIVSLVVARVSAT